MNEMWTHQQAAVDAATNNDAFLLSMDMGTGKSRCAIEWLRNVGARRSLLVAPKNVAELVWPGEFERWGNDEFTVVALPTKKSGKEKARVLADALALDNLVVVTHYDAVWRSPLADVVKDNITLFDAVILDESHRIKAAGSKVSWFFKNVGNHVKHKLCLTGTPLADKPLDIYGQARFLDPRLFGTNFNKFRKRYGVYRNWNGVEILDGYQNLDELESKIKSISFRVEADDVLDLPDQVDVVRYAEMPPKTSKFYKDLRRKLVAELDSGETTIAANSMVRVGKLHQVAQGFSRDEAVGDVFRLDTAKLDLFRDLLDDIDSPVIVYARYHEDLDALDALCKRQGLTTSELSGRVNSAAEWQSGKTDVLIAQSSTGTEGVNLTRGHIIVYYSLAFDLKSYTQSRARTRRPGQQADKCVYVHLLTKDSVDIDILDALRNKKSVNDRILR